MAQRPSIYAHFTPAGGALNLRQAAAILGVDHFNWQQTFTGPGTWQVLEGVGAATGPEQSPYTGLHDAQGYPIYNLEDDPEDAAPPAFADGTPVDLQAAPAPYYDPIVKVTGREMYVIKVLRFTLQDTVRYIAVPQDGDNPLPTYLAEGPKAEWQGFGAAGGTTSDGLDFVFIDRPANPDYALSGQNGVARPGFSMKFHTALVGITGSTVMPFGDPGTVFDWKSNSVFVGTNDNIVSGQAIAVTKPLPDFTPAISSGGVFDLQSQTSTPVATTTTLFTTANPSAFGQPVTLTALVMANSPGPTAPTGFVDFVDTTTGMDLGTVALANGLAAVTAPSLPVGTHSIAAAYSGDVSFQDSSAQITLTATPAPTPPPLTPPAAPPFEGITARLVSVKLRKKTRLMVEVFDAGSGALKGEFLSPFQRPAYTGIGVSVGDSNGDGLPDVVILTAHRGRKKVTRVLPG